MARHTITLPIVKSSNDFGYSAKTGVYYDAHGPQPYYTTPQAISTTLTIAFRSKGAKARFGIAWDDSLIPKDKELLKATFYFYTIEGHNRTIYYRYTDFAEGSTIPTHEPADGSVMGGVSYGWGSIDLGKPKGNSVVFSADFILEERPVYDIDGTFLTYDLFAQMWQLYSHRSPIYQPYVVIEYGDKPPEPPTSLYPSGIMMSTREIIRFSWTHKGVTDQKKFELQYSTNGGNSWTTITQNTPDQFYDLPAQTLPETGTVLWRVRTTDFNDETSEYSTATFTLGIPPQKAPIPVAPISQYIDENSSTTFEWIFTGGSASDVQSKIDLQYSTDGGTTWTTVTETTGETRLTLPSNTFAKGNVVWRVRTYNNWDEVSPYSEIKSFTVIGSPAIPLITEVSNEARPVVKWQTQEQQLYELEILKGEDAIYKTGVIPNATEREKRIPIYLDNGDYIARIRVINEYTLYSQWAEKNFSVSIDKPEQPSISVFNGTFKVTIKTDSGLNCYVYRDGVQIGAMANGIFEDFTGASNVEYKYFVRAIDVNDSFSDSDIKAAKCILTSNTIALYDEPSKFIKLQYGLDGVPQKLSTIEVKGELQYYDGRKYPVVEYSEFEAEEKSLSFLMESKKEVDEFRNLIRQKRKLLYRDIDGDVIIGEIPASLNIIRELLGYSVNFTIVRTV